MNLSDFDVLFDIYEDILYNLTYFITELSLIANLIIIIL